MKAGENACLEASLPRADSLIPEGQNPALFTGAGGETPKDWR